MMLRDEVKLFEKLSGESANDVTIVRLGSFLDGYYIGKEETVKHAHWIRNDFGVPICSACHKGWDDQPEKDGSPLFEYCPCCGAIMDEEVENG